MKIYTVGKNEATLIGQGDYITKTKITSLGAYGEKGMPPCFASKEKAEELAKAHHREVVELDLALNKVDSFTEHDEGNLQGIYNKISALVRELAFQNKVSQSVKDIRIETKRDKIQTTIVTFDDYERQKKRLTQNENVEVFKFITGLKALIDRISLALEGERSLTTEEENLINTLSYWYQDWKTRGSRDE